MFHVVAPFQVRGRTILQELPRVYPQVHGRELRRMHRRMWRGDAQVFFHPIVAAFTSFVSKNIFCAGRKARPGRDIRKFITALTELGTLQTKYGFISRIHLINSCRKIFGIALADPKIWARQYFALMGHSSNSSSDELVSLPWTYGDVW